MISTVERDNNLPGGHPLKCETIERTASAKIDRVSKRGDEDLQLSLCHLPVLAVRRYGIMGRSICLRLRRIRQRSIKFTANTISPVLLALGALDDSPAVGAVYATSTYFFLTKVFVSS